MNCSVPELPETETIARDLDGALRGAVVRSVEVVRRDVLRGDARTRPRRALATLANDMVADLTGAKVHGVSRRAKSVVVAFGTVCAGNLTPDPDTGIGKCFGSSPGCYITRNNL